MATVLTGLGTAVPERVVTNAELAATLDTSDEWIRTRTGIRERRVAAPGTRTADLAVGAAEEALKSAGASEADLVVLATSTPDHLMPQTAADVAARLGLGTVPAFDVVAACAGFPYALATADGLLSAGVGETALVVGAEIYSRIVDPADRGTAVLFGDGAGAIVIRRDDGDDPDAPGRIGPFDLGTDGERRESLWRPAGGAARPLDATALAEGGQYLRMNGKEVYREAVRRMVESSRAVLAAAGYEVDDVDRMVGHQANIRILDAVADRLGVPPERRVSNVHRYGNTSAASIPLALADADLSPGQLVLLTAFGAGMSWGSTLIRWPEFAGT